MIKVALTGGPGSGKSTVARMFRDLGAQVIDADEVARAVVRPREPAWEELRQEFGLEYFREDGSLDRENLAHLVFHDPEARKKLNAIVHPQVIREMARRLEELAGQGAGLVIVEVPLLFETGLEKNYDKIIVVDARETEQIDRLTARDCRSAAETAAIIAAQLPLSAKKARADFVVDNRGSLEDTRLQVEKLWRHLKNNLDKHSEKS